MCLIACQKRKADEYDPDATRSGDGLPPWVVSIDTLALYRQGVKLPDELKMSKRTLVELRRIKEWAAQYPTGIEEAANLASPCLQPTVQVIEAAQPRMPAASPPPTVHVQAMRPPVVPPAQALSAHPFDAVLLSRVAQLQNGPRVGM